MSTGLKYEWWCLQEKIKENRPFFVFENQEKEDAFIKIFSALDLQNTIQINSEKTNRLHRLKFILRNKFSGIYEIYKNLRYN